MKKITKTKKINRKTKTKSKSKSKKAIGGSKEDEISVISYNISWGAMTGDENDISDRTLAQECKKLDKQNPDDPTQCLTNVRAILEARKNTDFIALQEATNWEHIIKGSQKLKNMGYVHHKENNADLCTLYNSDKFKLLGINMGDLKKDFSSGGRPYHILFFKKKIENPNNKNKIYIFINFHNEKGEDIDKDKVENMLKPMNENFIYNVSLVKDINFDIKNKIPLGFLMSLNNFLNDEKKINPTFYVIMAGDTNDLKQHNYWQTGIQPFSKFNINNMDSFKNIKVDTQTNKPPNTCCVGATSIRKGFNEDDMYSDYVMISNNLEYVTSNCIFGGIEDPTPPSSDHLPVIAIIKEKEPRTVTSTA